MRRVLIVVSILSIIILYLLIFYFNQDFSIGKSKTPFSAIPENAIVITDLTYSPDLFEPYENNEFMSSIIGEKIESEWSFLKNLVDSFPAIKQAIENKNILISLHKTQENELSVLYVFEISSLRKVLTKDFEKRFIEQNNNIKVRNYEGVKIAELVIGNSKKSLNVGHKNGLLMLSFSSILLEKSIKQWINKAVLSEQPSFRDLQKFSNTRTNHEVYLNFERLSELFNVFTIPSANNKLSFLSEALKWSILTNNFKEDALMLNGITTVSDSSYLYPYLTQPPQKFGFNALASSRTAVKIDFAISDFNALITARKNQMLIKKNLAKYQARVNLINTKHSVDFDTDISNFIGNGVSYIIQENNSRNIVQELMAIMHVSDATRAIRFLSGYNEPSRVILNYPIYRVRFINFLSLAFGDIFSDIKLPFYTIIQNDNIVFANDLQTLERFINDYTAQQTLERDKNFSDFKLYLAERSTISVYASMDYSKSMIQPHLIAALNNDLRNRKSVGNLYGLSFQLSSKQDGFITNVYLQQSAGNQKRSAQTWMAKVDAPVRMKPIISFNSAINEQEIIFQDDDNNLYLLGNTGRLKWKVKMTEKIIGDIHPVDIGRNNRLDHFVFNTATRLFVINRNGRAKSGFPINLPRKSNSGLSLIPTSDEHGYRIFIETDNRAIYGYTISGPTMPGWNPKDRLGKLERSLIILQFSNQYYFLSPDEGGTFGIYNFAGRELFKIRERGNYRNPFYTEVKNSTSNTRFLSTDNKGNIVSIFLNGKTSVKSVADWSSKHYYLFGNIAGNSDGEHIFIDGNQLFVYSSDYTLLFKYDFPIDIMDPPFLVKVDDTGKFKLGVIFRPTNQVYLFNEDGTVMDGFPIKGSSPVSASNLTNDQRKYVVVGGQDSRIYAYELR